jgi:hypothetical protein
MGKISRHFSFFQQIFWQAGSEKHQKRGTAVPRQTTDEPVDIFRRVLFLGTIEFCDWVGAMLKATAAVHAKQFCVKTTTIREIRGWGPAMPVPQSPQEIMGVMNLRGAVIPIVNLAAKLGMAATEPTERSAIVVAEVYGLVMGLLVDSVSDILDDAVGEADVG